jgi:hypothetical protein
VWVLSHPNRKFHYSDSKYVVCGCISVENYTASQTRCTCDGNRLARQKHTSHKANALFANTSGYEISSLKRCLARSLRDRWAHFGELSAVSNKLASGN